MPNYSDDYDIRSQPETISQNETAVLNATAFNFNYIPSFSAVYMLETSQMPNPFAQIEKLCLSFQCYVANEFMLWVKWCSKFKHIHHEMKIQLSEIATPNDRFSHIEFSEILQSYDY